MMCFVYNKQLNFVFVSCHISDQLAQLFAQPFRQHAQTVAGQVERLQGAKARQHDGKLFDLRVRGVKVAHSRADGQRCTRQRQERRWQVGRQAGARCGWMSVLGRSRHAGGGGAVVAAEGSKLLAVATS